MREQLQRLADASELPNIEILVLPFSLHHAVAVDSFAILAFGSADDTILHEVVSMEHLSNELYFEGDTDINQFKLAFDRIREKSKSPAESRKLILDIVRDTWG